MLELVDVTVRRAGVTVLQGASARLAPGVTLLTGPNGAGKTTLLHTLAGLIPPASGEVRWRGRPIAAQLQPYRHRLGYLPQRPATYPEMTVAAFLDYLSALKAIPADLAARRRNELLAALDLAGAARTPMCNLSEGQRRLVGAAQALLADPEVLLLDEPLENLDGESRARLLHLCHRPGRATLLATHRQKLVPPGLVAHWRLHEGRLTVESLNDPCPRLVSPG